jgi:hypothetical protein
MSTIDVFSPQIQQLKESSFLHSRHHEITDRRVVIYSEYTDNSFSNIVLLRIKLTYYHRNGIRTSSRHEVQIIESNAIIDPFSPNSSPLGSSTALPNEHLPIPTLVPDQQLVHIIQLPSTTQFGSSPTLIDEEGNYHEVPIYQTVPITELRESPDSASVTESEL